MLMSVMEITDVNMDAKILLVAIGVAVHRDMFNITNGTNVLVRKFSCDINLIHLCVYLKVYMGFGEQANSNIHGDFFINEKNHACSKKTCRMTRAHSLIELSIQSLPNVMQYTIMIYKLQRPIPSLGFDPRFRC